MKKLLNTLYVISQDNYLALEGENIVIKKNDEVIARFPFHLFESIYCFSYCGISPALIGECAQRKIALSFLTPTGRFLARVCAPNIGNVLLRRKQYRIADDVKESLELSIQFIQGKLSNSRYVLERALRDHTEQIDAESVKEKSVALKEFISGITNCTSHEELRGIEGKAATYYFRGMNQLIMQNRDTFYFAERSRRPPLDPMNSLLSFLYTLLTQDCASALECVGLDSYVGFLHRDQSGRSSLALDLMEELRPALVDRLALTLINHKMVTYEHFQHGEQGGVFLTCEGRKIVITAWQNHKKSEITHPILNEKIPWGLVPYSQAMLLAKVIRGELKAYPSFLWK